MTQRFLRLALSLVAALCGVLALLALLSVSGEGPAAASPAAAPTVRYVVGPLGQDEGTCVNSTSPCKTIQYALNKAVAGDVIRVGSYLTPTVYLGPISLRISVTLEGGWSVVVASQLIWRRSVPCEAFRTVIDGQGEARAVEIFGPIAPVIDCFTISGGDASGLGGDPTDSVDNDAGGGIFSQGAAPIISNNIITGNVGCSTCPVSYGRGGGIYLIDAPASTLITGNTITANWADQATWGRGGGIMMRNSDAQVIGNTFAGNRAGLSAGEGGAIIVVGGSPRITNNAFLGNHAGGGVACSGGAIYVSGTSGVDISGNVFNGNRALIGKGLAGMRSSGGAVSVLQSSVSMRDNTFAVNMASTQSAGIGGALSLGSVTSTLVAGNVFSGNLASHNADGSGGAIYALNSAFVAEDNTFIGNGATWSGLAGYGGAMAIQGENPAGPVLIHTSALSGNFGTGFPGAGSGWGGGMVFSATAVTLEDCTFYENTACNGETSGTGGGLYGSDSDVTVLRSTFSSNSTGPLVTVGVGGGMYLDACTAVLEQNSILENAATGSQVGLGGGVRLTAAPAYRMVNNIVAGNQASSSAPGVSVLVSGPGSLIHNTIVSNTGGDGVGFYFSPSRDSVALTNNIVVGHMVGITNDKPVSGSVRAEATLFERNALDYEAGVVSLLEVDGPADLTVAYRLGLASAAIDAGVDARVYVDIDGQPRPSGSGPDVGADEVSAPILLPLVLHQF